MRKSMAPTLNSADKEMRSEKISLCIPLAFWKKRKSLPMRKTRTTRSRFGVIIIPVRFRLSITIPVKQQKIHIIAKNFKQKLQNA